MPAVSSDHYLSRSRGWSASPEGADVCLRTRLEQRTAGHGENVFFVRRGQDWVPVREDQLAPEQRALVWKLWPQRIDGREFVAFRGLRVVDDFLLAGPLAGLALHDLHGRPLADPRGAGEVFLLTPQDAQAFARAVRAIGGRLERIDSWLPEIEQSFAGLDESRRLLQLLLQRDLEFLAQLERGDHSGQLDFDARGKQVRELVARARHLVSQMRRDMEELSRTSTATRARGEELIERAGVLLHEVDALGEARSRLEEHVARLMRRNEGRSDSSTRLPDLALEVLLRDLAELWRAAGHEVENEDGRLIVEAAGLRLEIGRQIAIAPPPEDEPEPEPFEWAGQGGWPQAASSGPS